MTTLPLKFNTHEKNDWLERNLYLDFNPTEIEIDNERVVKLQGISRSHLSAQLEKYKHYIEFLPKGLRDKSREIDIKSLINVNPPSHIGRLNQHHDFVFPIGIVDLYAGDLEYSHKYTPNTPQAIVAMVYMAYSGKDNTCLVVAINDKIIGYYNYEIGSYISNTIHSENQYTISIGGKLLTYDDSPQTNGICRMTIVNDHRNHFYLNLVSTMVGYWFESKFNPIMHSCIAPTQRLSTIQLGNEKNYQIYRSLFGSRGIINRLMSLDYVVDGVASPVFRIYNRLTLPDVNSTNFDVEYYLDTYIDFGEVVRYPLEIVRNSRINKDNYDTVKIIPDKKNEVVEFIIPINRMITDDEPVNEARVGKAEMEYALKLSTPADADIEPEFIRRLKYFIEKDSEQFNVLYIAPVGDAIHGDASDYTMMTPSQSNKEEKKDESENN